MELSKAIPIEDAPQKIAHPTKPIVDPPLGLWYTSISSAIEVTDHSQRLFYEFREHIHQVSFVPGITIPDKVNRMHP